MAISPSDPLVRIEGLSAINGPASVNAVLLDSVQTANFEGIWVPWLFVKQGSLEVSGVMSTLSLQLYGTNSLSPTNSYTLTIGGSATNMDVVTIAFNFPGLPAINVPFTVTTGLTNPQIATGVGNAINASATLLAIGVSASVSSNVVTVTWPSSAPLNSIGQFSSTSSSPVALFLNLSSSVSGSATETVTIAPGVGGSTVGSAITALGMTQFTISARYLKIRITTLTGGGATITAIAQGTA